MIFRFVNVLCMGQSILKAYKKFSKVLNSLSFLVQICKGGSFYSDFKLFLRTVSRFVPLCQSTLVRRIERVQSGNLGDVKSVGESVYEIRIDMGPGYRLYYMMRGDEIIILLVGGDKSTQQRDIEKAIEMAKEI